MFEKQLTAILIEHLSHYVAGLNEQQLSLSLWSGEVVLHDLQLQASLLSEGLLGIGFELPLQLTKGVIGTLSIHIPWSTLEYEPVAIEISDIDIVCVPIVGGAGETSTGTGGGPSSDESENFQKAQKLTAEDVRIRAHRRKEHVLQYFESLRDQSPQIEGIEKSSPANGSAAAVSSSTGSGGNAAQRSLSPPPAQAATDTGAPEEVPAAQAGYFQSLVKIITRNVQLSVKNLRVKLDYGYPGLHPSFQYALDFFFEEVFVITTDEEWRPRFLSDPTLRTAHRIASLENCSLAITPPQAKDKHELLKDLSGSLYLTLVDDVNVTADVKLLPLELAVDIKDIELIRTTLSWLLGSGVVEQHDGPTDSSKLVKGIGQTDEFLSLATSTIAEKMTFLANAQRKLSEAGKQQEDNAATSTPTVGEPRQPPPNLSISRLFPDTTTSAQPQPPKTWPESAAKKRWRRAIETVIAIARERRKEWSWENISTFCSLRDRYVSLHKRRQQVPWLPPLNSAESAEVAGMEEELTVPQIVFLRCVAYSELVEDQYQFVEERTRIRDASKRRAGHNQPDDGAGESNGRGAWTSWLNPASYLGGAKGSRENLPSTDSQSSLAQFGSSAELMPPGSVSSAGEALEVELELAKRFFSCKPFARHHDIHSVPSPPGPSSTRKTAKTGPTVSAEFPSITLTLRGREYIAPVYPGSPLLKSPQGTPTDKGSSNTTYDDTVTIQLDRFHFQFSPTGAEVTVGSIEGRITSFWEILSRELAGVEDRLQVLSRVFLSCTGAKGTVAESGSKDTGSAAQGQKKEKRSRDKKDSVAVVFQIDHRKRSTALRLAPLIVTDAPIEVLEGFVSQFVEALGLSASQNRTADSSPQGSRSAGTTKRLETPVDEDTITILLEGLDVGVRLRSPATQHSLRLWVPRLQIHKEREEHSCEGNFGSIVTAVLMSALRVELVASDAVSSPLVSITDGLSVRHKRYNQRDQISLASPATRAGFHPELSVAFNSQPRLCLSPKVVAALAQGLVQDPIPADTPLYSVNVVASSVVKTTSPTGSAHELYPSGAAGVTYGTFLATLHHQGRFLAKVSRVSGSRKKLLCCFHDGSSVTLEASSPQVQRLWYNALSFAAVPALHTPPPVDREIQLEVEPEASSILAVSIDYSTATRNITLELEVETPESATALEVLFSNFELGIKLNTATASPLGIDVQCGTLTINKKQPQGEEGALPPIGQLSQFEVSVVSLGKVARSVFDNSKVRQSFPPDASLPVSTKVALRAARADIAVSSPFVATLEFLNGMLTSFTRPSAAAKYLKLEEKKSPLPTLEVSVELCHMTAVVWAMQLCEKVSGGEAGPDEQYLQKELPLVRAQLPALKVSVNDDIYRQPLDTSVEVSLQIASLSRPETMNTTRLVDLVNSHSPMEWVTAMVSDSPPAAVEVEVLHRALREAPQFAGGEVTQDLFASFVKVRLANINMTHYHNFMMKLAGISSDPTIERLTVVSKHPGYYCRSGRSSDILAVEHRLFGAGPLRPFAPIAIDVELDNLSLKLPKTADHFVFESSPEDGLNAFVKHVSVTSALTPVPPRQHQEGQAAPHSSPQKPQRPLAATIVSIQDVAIEEGRLLAIPSLSVTVTPNPYDAVQSVRLAFPSEGLEAKLKAKELTILLSLIAHNVLEPVPSADSGTVLSLEVDIPQLNLTLSDDSIPSPAGGPPIAGPIVQVNTGLRLKKEAGGRLALTPRTSVRIEDLYVGVSGVPAPLSASQFAGKDLIVSEGELVDLFRCTSLAIDVVSYRQGLPPTSGSVAASGCQSPMTCISGKISSAELVPLVRELFAVRDALVSESNAPFLCSILGMADDPQETLSLRAVHPPSVTLRATFEVDGLSLSLLEPWKEPVAAVDSTRLLMDIQQSSDAELKVSLQFLGELAVQQQLTPTVLYPNLMHFVEVDLADEEPDASVEPILHVTLTIPPPSREPLTDYTQTTKIQVFLRGVKAVVLPHVLLRLINLGANELAQLAAITAMPSDRRKKEESGLLSYELPKIEVFWEGVQVVVPSDLESSDSWELTAKSLQVANHVEQLSVVQPGNPRKTSSYTADCYCVRLLECELTPFEATLPMIQFDVKKPILRTVPTWIHPTMEVVLSCGKNTARKETEKRTEAEEFYPVEITLGLIRKALRTLEIPKLITTQPYYRASEGANLSLTIDLSSVRFLVLDTNEECILEIDTSMIVKHLQPFDSTLPADTSVSLLGTVVREQPSGVTLICGSQSEVSLNVLPEGLALNTNGVRVLVDGHAVTVAHRLQAFGALVSAVVAENEKSTAAARTSPGTTALQPPSSSAGTSSSSSAAALSVAFHSTFVEVPGVAEVRIHSVSVDHAGSGKADITEVHCESVALHKLLTPTSPSLGVEDRGPALNVHRVSVQLKHGEVRVGLSKTEYSHDPDLLTDMFVALTEVERFITANVKFSRNEEESFRQLLIINFEKLTLNASETQHGRMALVQFPGLIVKQERTTTGSSIGIEGVEGSCALHRAGDETHSYVLSPNLSFSAKVLEEEISLKMAPVTLHLPVDELAEDLSRIAFEATNPLAEFLEHQQQSAGLRSRAAVSSPGEGVVAEEASVVAARPTPSLLLDIPMLSVGLGCPPTTVHAHHPHAGIASVVSHQHFAVHIHGLHVLRKCTPGSDVSEVRVLQVTSTIDEAIQSHLLSVRPSSAAQTSAIVLRTADDRPADKALIQSVRSCHIGAVKCCVSPLLVDTVREHFLQPLMLGLRTAQHSELLHRSSAKRDWSYIGSRIEGMEVITIAGDTTLTEELLIGGETGRILHFSNKEKNLILLNGTNTAAIHIHGSECILLDDGLSVMGSGLRFVLPTTSTSSSSPSPSSFLSSEYVVASGRSYLHTDNTCVFAASPSIQGMAMVAPGGKPDGRLSSNFATSMLKNSLGHPAQVNWSFVATVELTLSEGPRKVCMSFNAGADYMQQLLGTSIESENGEVKVMNVEVQCNDGLITERPVSFEANIQHHLPNRPSQRHQRQYSSGPEGDGLAPSADQQQGEELVEEPCTTVRAILSNVFLSITRADCALIANLLRSSAKASETLKQSARKESSTSDSETRLAMSKRHQRSPGAVQTVSPFKLDVVVNAPKFVFELRSNLYEPILRIDVTAGSYQMTGRRDFSSISTTCSLRVEIDERCGAVWKELLSFSPQIGVDVATFPQGGRSFEVEIGIAEVVAHLPLEPLVHLSQQTSIWFAPSYTVANRCGIPLSISGPARTALLESGKTTPMDFVTSTNRVLSIAVVLSGADEHQQGPSPTGKMGESDPASSPLHGALVGHDCMQIDLTNIEGQQLGLANGFRILCEVDRQNHRLIISSPLEIANACDIPVALCGIDVTKVSLSPGGGRAFVPLQDFQKPLAVEAGERYRGPIGCSIPGGACAESMYVVTQLAARKLQMDEESTNSAAPFRKDILFHLPDQLAAECASTASNTLQSAKATFRATYRTQGAKTVCTVAPAIRIANNTSVDLYLGPSIETLTCVSHGKELCLYEYIPADGKIDLCVQLSVLGPGTRVTSSRVLKPGVPPSAPPTFSHTVQCLIEATSVIELQDGQGKKFALVMEHVSPGLLVASVPVLLENHLPTAVLALQVPKGTTVGQPFAGQQGPNSVAGDSFLPLSNEELTVRAARIGGAISREVTAEERDVTKMAIRIDEEREGYQVNTTSTTRVFESTAFSVPPGATIQVTCYEKAKRSGAEPVAYSFYATRSVPPLLPPTDLSGSEENPVLGRHPTLSIPLPTIRLRALWRIVNSSDASLEIRTNGFDELTLPPGGHYDVLRCSAENPIQPTVQFRPCNYGGIKFLYSTSVPIHTLQSTFTVKSLVAPLCLEEDVQEPTEEALENLVEQRLTGYESQSYIPLRVEPSHPHANQTEFSVSLGARYYPLLIENRTTVSLEMRQVGCDSEAFVLPPFKSTKHTWDVYTDELQVEFMFAKGQRLTVNPARLATLKESVPMGKKFLHIWSTFEPAHQRYCLVVTADRSLEAALRFSPQQIINASFYIHQVDLCLTAELPQGEQKSAANSGTGVRSEVAALLVEDIMASVSDNGERRLLALRCGDLALEDCSGTTQEEIVVRQHEGGKDALSIAVHTKHTHASNFAHICEAQVVISPIDIALHDAFLWRLMHCANAVALINEEHNRAEALHQKNNAIDAKRNPNGLTGTDGVQCNADDEQPELQQKATISYLMIEKLHIGVVSLNFSLQRRSDGSPSPFQQITGGFLIRSIERAPLSFSEVVMSSTFASSDSILTTVVSSYRSQAVWQAYRVIGSMELIGNPVRLVTSVSEGLRDFVVETIQLRPFQGAKCLALSSVSGSLHTMSLLARAGGSTFALLGCDTEFQRQRDEERLRGEQSGFLWNTGRGFVSGISGVVTKPVSGAMKGGVVGLVQGLGTGVLGVVTRPAAAILDGISNSTENAATIMDDARRRSLGTELRHKKRKKRRHVPQPTSSAITSTPPPAGHRRASSTDVSAPEEAAEVLSTVSNCSSSGTSGTGALYHRNQPAPIEIIVGVLPSQLKDAEKAIEEGWNPYMQSHAPPVTFHNYAHLARDAALAMELVSRENIPPRAVPARGSLDRPIHLRATLGVREALKYISVEDAVAITSWAELRKAFPPEEFRATVAPLAFRRWREAWLMDKE